MKTIFISFFILIYCLSSCAPGFGNRKRWLSYANGRDKIIRTAKRYLGVKYRYGGTTPIGFDCSGFVMYVYRKNGIPLPRDLKGQFKMGKRVSIRKARPGDLVFFRTRRSRKRISHVGIYMGKGRFIHSPSSGKRVSIAKVTNTYWRRTYIGSVSILGKPKEYKRYTQYHNKNKDTRLYN